MITITDFHRNYLHTRWITAGTAPAHAIEGPLEPQDLESLVFGQVQRHRELAEVLAEEPHHAVGILLGREQVVIATIDHGEPVVVLPTTENWLIL